MTHKDYIRDGNEEGVKYKSADPHFNFCVPNCTPTSKAYNKIDNFNSMLPELFELHKFNKHD